METPQVILRGELMWPISKQLSTCDVSIAHAGRLATHPLRHGDDEFEVVPCC